MWITSDAIRYGHAAGGGSPSHSTNGSAMTAPATVTSAVSALLSPPDLISPFHDACSSAAHSTTSTMGQVRVIVRNGSARLVCRCRGGTRVRRSRRRVHERATFGAGQEVRERRRG